KRKVVLAAEVVVLFHRIAGHADDGRACVLEVRVQVAEILAFLRAAGRVVARVEVQYQQLTGEVRRVQRAVAAGGGGKRRCVVVDVYSHGGTQVLTGSSRPSACNSSHKSMKLSR